LATLLFAPEDQVSLDFSGKDLPADWRSSRNWKVEQGELRGLGDGWLEWSKPVPRDFTLTFSAWTEEKANVEVKLYDPKGEQELYTFAFMGRYHPVLDGVKSAILKADRFVAQNPRMWIFPGRMFAFELRSAKGAFQMFLSNELGPVFRDEAPPEAREFRLRILCSTEGKRDQVRLDDVKVSWRK